jgi:hypothetical protein
MPFGYDFAGRLSPPKYRRVQVRQPSGYKLAKPSELQPPLDWATSAVR